jgi:hypothetical protein
MDEIRSSKILKTFDFGKVLGIGRSQNQLPFSPKATISFKTINFFVEGGVVLIFAHSMGV